MKNLKILLLLITFSSLSQASYLLDKNTVICIEDYYYLDNRIYFQKSTNMSWGSTSEDHTSDHIKDGYIFDSATGKCTPNDARILGLEQTQYNFLMALSGLLFSFIVVLVISSFLTGL